MTPKPAVRYGHPIVMDREVLDRWCEYAVVAVVAVLVTFGPLAAGAVRPREFLVLQVLVVALAVLWVLRLWVAPAPRLVWSPTHWAVLAFVAYAVVRYTQADIEYVARQELIRIFVYALLFLALTNSIRHQKSVAVIVTVLVVLGMVEAMYAVVQYLRKMPVVWHLGGPSIQWPAYIGRGSGTYIYPNALAGLLAMILPLGLAASVRGHGGPAQRILLAYAALTGLVGLAVTLSRGGWLAGVFALFLLWVLVSRHRRYRLAAGAGLALMALAVGVFLIWNVQAQARLRELDSISQQESGRLRVSLLRTGYRMWCDHVWWGVGPAHFDYRFPAYRPETIQARPGWVHNDYLNTLVDYGAVGFALVAATFAALYAGVFKTWKYVKREGDIGTTSSNRAAFMLGASTGLAAMLVHSLTDFTMHIPANAIVAVTLIALLANYRRFATRHGGVRLGLLTQILLALGILAAGGYLVHEGARKGREEGCLQRAAAVPDPSEPRLAALREAARLEPMNPETPSAIGETLRLLSWQGETGYEKLAQEAMAWFERGRLLNPFDPYNDLRRGMCLDWLGRHDEAGACFAQAANLDPNNYYVVAFLGWHRVQIGDFAAARPCFQRSIDLVHPKPNPIAWSYLGIVDQKLREAGQSPAPK